MKHPEIIQGGMGVGVSGWRLARTVSAAGHLGVVSGTALDIQLARRLQLGDPGGHLRRAMARFPDSRLVAEVEDRYFVPGGIAPDQPFRSVTRFGLDPHPMLSGLAVLGNFVEVFLAKEGHDGAVGINYLEKIQLSILPSLYGALLAGVDYVLVGAGIPFEIPGALTALVEHREASTRLDAIKDARMDSGTVIRFDPARHFSARPRIERPLFLPIISSASLARILLNRADGPVDGFVVEAPEAGGHNAPPRGKTRLDEGGEPIYGARDRPGLQELRSLGRPFWLAGGQGHSGSLARARELGAAGIQVGTAFAFCRESGLDPRLRRQAIDRILAGSASVRTDPLASPTGFPFKVLELPGTLSEKAVYEGRRRICDLGYLRRVFRRPDRSPGYRCPAEPTEAYVRKGGREDDTVGRKCLCNALVANIGLGQRGRANCVEPPLLTAGRDLECVRHFLEEEGPDYGAADVLRALAEPFPAGVL